MARDQKLSVAKKQQSLKKRKAGFGLIRCEVWILPKHKKQIKKIELSSQIEAGWKTNTPDDTNTN